MARQAGQGDGSVEMMARSWAEFVRDDGKKTVNGVSSAAAAEAGAGTAQDAFDPDESVDEDAGLSERTGTLSRQPESRKTASGSSERDVGKKKQGEKTPGARLASARVSPTVAVAQAVRPTAEHPPQPPPTGAAVVVVDPQLVRFGADLFDPDEAVDSSDEHKEKEMISLLQGDHHHRVVKLFRRRVAKALQMLATTNPPAATKWRRALACENWYRRNSGCDKSNKIRNNKPTLSTVELERIEDRTHIRITLLKWAASVRPMFFFKNAKQEFVDDVRDVQAQVEMHIRSLPGREKWAEEMKKVKQIGTLVRRKFDLRHAPPAPELWIHPRNSPRSSHGGGALHREEAEGRGRKRHRDTSEEINQIRAYSRAISNWVGDTARSLVDGEAKGKKSLQSSPAPPGTQEVASYVEDLRTRVVKKLPKERRAKWILPLVRAGVWDVVIKHDKILRLGPFGDGTMDDATFGGRGRRGGGEAKRATNNKVGGREGAEKKSEKKSQLVPVSGVVWGLSRVDATRDATRNATRNPARSKSTHHSALLDLEQLDSTRPQTISSPKTPELGKVSGSSGRKSPPAGGELVGEDPDAPDKDEDGHDEHLATGHQPNKHLATGPHQPNKHLATVPVRRGTRSRKPFPSIAEIRSAMATHEPPAIPIREFVNAKLREWAGVVVDRPTGASDLIANIEIAFRSLPPLPHDSSTTTRGPSNSTRQPHDNSTLPGFHVAVGRERDQKRVKILFAELRGRGGSITSITLRHIYVLLWPCMYTNPVLVVVVCSPSGGPRVTRADLRG